MDTANPVPVHFVNRQDMTIPSPRKTNQTKKILIRRPEMVKGKIPWSHWRHVQLWRHTVQAGFILLNIYLGIRFYFWVRYYETGGQGTYMHRSDGVEGWLPIAGLMNLKYALTSMQIPPVHAASMFLLVAFLLVSLLLKKSFCSWLCPIGTLSEVLWQGGKAIFKRNFHLPRWLDIPLRSLKYVLLAFFLYIAFTMPSVAIRGFMASEYGILADVKMLNFFRYMGLPTAITLGVLFIGSIFIPNLWCRYLCPYGALMGLTSLFSPYKIRRDTQACVDCGKCARVCPSCLPVDVKLQIRSVECTACQSCIDICPAQDALQFSLPPSQHEAVNGDMDGLQRRWSGRKLSGNAVAILLVLIVGGIICGAKLSDHWQTRIPEKMYQVLIPKATSIAHP